MIGLRKHCSFFALLITLVHGSMAQGVPAALAEFVGDPCVRDASVGFLLVDLAGDSTLAAHNADKALPPASTLKVLTTVQALDQLPSDFTILTILGFRGVVQSDTLIGDLIIRGAGDPSLGSQHHNIPFNELIQKWGQAISQAGIKHLTGDVIGDASSLPKGEWLTKWPFEDLGNYYGATPCALNIRDNEYTVTLRQNPLIDGQVKIQNIEPQVPNLTLESFVKSGARGSGDQAYIIGAPMQLDRYIRGTIPLGDGPFKIRGSLPDPPAFLAHHIYEHLQRKGITIEGQARSSYDYVGSIQGIDTVRSLALHKIVALINQKSINLYAEALGLQLDRLLGAGGRNQYWKEKGLSVDHCRLIDYSGLAPDNALTPRSMIDVLSFAYHRHDLFERLLPSLSVAGKSGTLSKMFRQSPAMGSIYAKSGLINGVRNYAGYIKTKSGRWLAFCIYTFNPGCKSQVVRKKLEHLLESLYLSTP